LRHSGTGRVVPGNSIKVELCCFCPAGFSGSSQRPSTSLLSVMTFLMDEFGRGSCIMDRERDTGQYLSFHHERRRQLASVKCFSQLSKSNQGTGNDPS
jgi:hypothetical protein